jgi:phosphopantetheinyl transferase (holo-ACP synthase)
MSVIINKIYTVTFASKEDKTKAIGYLFHSNFAFKGIALDTIEVQEDAYNALTKQDIKFK